MTCPVHIPQPVRKHPPAGRTGPALVGLTFALAVFGAGCQTTGHRTAPPAPTKAAQAAMTPAAALERLKAGNARYVAGRSLERDWATSRAETAGGNSLTR